MTPADRDRRAVLEAEIRDRLGLVPEFFRSDDPPEISERFWAHAKVAYLDNEIPSIFKEQLFTYLSRFCEVPYCMIRHAAFLQGIGQPAGDAGAKPRAAAEVLRLLHRPTPDTEELERHLKTLGKAGPTDAWPEDIHGVLGEALFACSVHVFLGGGTQRRSLIELRQALGPMKLERLLSFLGFIRAAHAWTQAQPDLEFERDLTELLEAQPELRSWLDRYRIVASSEFADNSADLLHLSSEHRTLGESAEHLGAILENSVNEIFVFDADTLRFLQVNRGARENLGYSMGELRHLTPVDLKPEFSRQDFDDLLAPLRAGTKRRLEFSTIHQRKDGSLYPVEIHLQLSDVGESPSFVAIVLDISERREQEEALAESAARAHVLLDTAADAIVTISETGIIEGANTATTSIFGYDEAELIGNNVRMLMPPPYADEHDGYLSHYLKTGEAKIIGSGREVEARRKDGSVFPIRLSIGEARFANRRLFTGIIHDLTQTRELQQQLLQSQKMEAIGTLAGGIAHDFNNLLTSIRGSSEILSEHLEPGGRLARSAERIQRASDRAAALTTRLLGFSRRQVTQRRAVDLNGAVEETKELFVRTLPEDVELKTDLAREALYAEADEGQVGQVLMNLFVNAADAMPSGGTLQIATSRETLHGHRAATLGLPAADYVAVTVRDNGTGIPPETRAKIFDPFFTTKETGKGTGLGLSTALGIIRDHGGAIEVRTEVGNGTGFTVLLPRIEAPEAQASVDAGTTARESASGETILLVEDDDIMRDLLTEVLGDEGYSVLAAAHPAEALRHASAKDQQIDLVITDVVMPQMSGFLLAKELRAQHASVHVLYMSGYTDQMLADRGELSDADPFLRKPFSNDALLAKVREVLSP